MNQGEGFRLHLNTLRDGVVTAIRGEDVAGVEKGIGIYLKLVDSFYEHLKQIVGDDVFAEGQPWEEMRWVYEDHLLFQEEASHSSRSGEHFGRHLASSEVRRVLDGMVAGVPVREFESPEETRLDKILEVRDELMREGVERPSILLIDTWAFNRHIHLDDQLDWQGAGQRKDEGLMGRIRGSEIFTLRSGGPPRVLVADLNEFGEWRQASADAVATPFELHEAGTVKLALAPILTEEAEEMVAAEPNRVLRNRDGVRETPEQAVERLQRSVRFQIYSRVTWHARSPDAGVVIRFDDGDSGD